jgi:hypothetical protein
VTSELYCQLTLEEKQFSELFSTMPMTGTAALFVEKYSNKSFACGMKH